MELKIQLFDLTLAFSRMVDRVMPQLARHNTRVAFFIGKVSEMLDLPPETQQRVILAGLLHDVGALPLRVTADELIFERNCEGHSVAGERLLLNCPPLRHLAPSVRYHHTPWPHLDSQNPDHRLAALINIADRVDVFTQSNVQNANMFNKLQEQLQRDSGKIFSPIHVQAMCATLQIPDLRRRVLEAPETLEPKYIGCCTPITMTEVRQFSQFMGHVIDSRSPFTATHSAGVAQTACALAELAGMPPDQMDALYISGMLHDIGKLDIPLGILEKPGPLTRDEAAIMSSHAELSEKWLDSVPGFAKISRWGALHHERMNGSGYPHGYAGDTLEPCSRLMAVADVFTAITEDRPYRIGMPLKRAVEILSTMSHVHLDPTMVAIAVENAEIIDAVRRAAQDEAGCLYAACRDVPKEPDRSEEDDRLPV